MKRIELTTRQRAKLVDAIVISCAGVWLVGWWQVLVWGCRFVVWMAGY